MYARLKKRIVRTLIEEIVVDADGRAGEIIAVVHWKGGVHTEVCIRAGDAATAELTRRRRLWTQCEYLCASARMIRLPAHSAAADCSREWETAGHVNE